MRLHCRNKPDTFCYICGCYSLNRQRRNISLFVKRAYKAYFEVHLGDQDKQWAPYVVCHNCEEMLRDWTKGKRKGLPFGVPRIWRELYDHVTDCYCCMVNTTGVGKKNRHKITYPNIPSAIWPVPPSEEVPVPVFKALPSLLHWAIKTLDMIQASKTVVTVNCQKRVHNRKTVLQTLNISSSPGWTDWFSEGFRSFKESSRAFGIKITRQKSCWSIW